ncbi:MAG: DEAD/DEAH box helicase [Candidatus Nanoarchaeia archaeon]
MKFKDLGLGNHLFTAINRMGFETPTKIQAEAIPLILDGQDVVGESATGSGKTLAFGCGVVDLSLPGKGLQALVLTPTRELAEQVKVQIQEIADDIQIAAIYGGVAFGPQLKALKTAEVVVATPGRLLDHLRQGTIDTRKIKILVLDEADRMLDMGFIDDVEKIMKECPKDRQNLFFSATISPRIKQLANKYMYEPQTVTATKMVDPSKLKQIYFNVSRNQKLSLLVHLLHKEKSGLVIVFSNTRRNTDFIVKNLKANNVDALAIHGGLSQNKRTRTITSFNDGKAHVLVCTDVAARGIHIDNVSHVYNYEIPKDPKDYVHRIGRTARAGEEGKVINLLCDVDHSNFDRIIREYRAFRIDRVEQPQLPRIKIVVERQGFRDRRGNSGRGFRGRSSGRSGRSDSRGRRGRSDGRGPRRGPRSSSRGPRGHGSSRGSSRGRSGLRKQRVRAY